MTFILIHGSWHNGQAWHKVEPQLSATGYPVYAPTLLGLESITVPSVPENGLYKHIEQIETLIESQSITDAILVGHSYSGLVISEVAAHLPKQVRKLVFLDAFIPDDGQSLFDILGSESETQMRQTLVDAAGKSLADGAKDVWLLPPGNPAEYGVTDLIDDAWLRMQLAYTPVSTFEEKVRIPEGFDPAIKSYFIRCTEFAFLASQEQKAKSLGWPIFSIKTGHDAMITEPEAVAKILMHIHQDEV